MPFGTVILTSITCKTLSWWGQTSQRSLAVHVLTKIQRYFCESQLTLSNGVRLDITIIVLAGPHKTTLTLESLCYHVIYQPVFIPDALSLKLRLVVTVIVRRRHRHNLEQAIVSIERDANIQPKNYSCPHMHKACSQWYVHTCVCLNYNHLS